MSSDAARIESIRRPRWKWFRYSLRSLLLLVTMICVVIAWKVVPTLQQTYAINALKGTGRYVTFQYDYQFRHIENEKGKPAPEPSWVAKIFGVDAVHDIVKVQIIDDEYRRPEDFQQAVSSLYYLPRLRYLQIYAPRSAPLDLTPLARLKNLEELHLYEDRVDDDALQNLHRLDHLWNLNLGSNRISDGGLAALSNL